MINNAASEKKTIVKIVGGGMKADDKKVIYVCGPMSGFIDWNKEAFYRAENYLRSQADIIGKKTVILNPASLPNGLEQHEYMDICLAMVRACTHIYALAGWENSKGATVEHNYGEKLNKEIMYQTSECSHG